LKKSLSLCTIRVFQRIRAFESFLICTEFKAPHRKKSRTPWTHRAKQVDPGHWHLHTKNHATPSVADAIDHLVDLGDFVELFRDARVERGEEPGDEEDEDEQGDVAKVPHIQIVEFNNEEGDGTKDQLRRGAAVVVITCGHKYER